MFLLLACSPSGADRVATAGAAAASDETRPADTHAVEDTGPLVDTGKSESADGTESGGGVSCGDGTCGTDESCWDCAGDCGSCDCPIDVQVVLYTASAWTVLADALAADPSPCADYYISIPAPSTDKTTPRAGEADDMRRARVHPMAEFHWGQWAEASGDWYDKGVEFRRRMADAGYDVSEGDTWAINELPSSVRYDDTTRQNALDAFRGLYEGPEGSPTAKGTAFIVGMGQGTQNFAVYEPYLEDWLEDATFWEQANLHVAYWAQEVYTDPHYVCVDGSTTAERSEAVNAYVQHVARHAEVGPDTANTAQSYLGRAYTPLMNAVWQSDSGYGDTNVSLEEMEQLVSLQVYAARSWSNDHAYPDGRLGFGWDRQDGVDDADLAVLAARLASAIHYAYDAGGGGASYACSPTGAYTWCACYVDGAEFNDAWDTLSTW